MKTDPIGAYATMRGVKRAVSWLVLPGFAAASMLGLAFALANDIPVPIALAVGGALFGGLLILLERWLPHAEAWQRGRGDVVTDAIHLVVTGLVVSSLPGLIAPGGLVQLWPAGWPLAGQVALAIVTKDAVVYWSHRALHRYLWRVHAIHHSAERLYFLNTWRAHPIEGLVSATAAVLPLVALGAPAEVALYAWSFTSVFAMVQHSNVEVRTGPLDLVFATPAMHRWHHSPEVRETDSNFGNILSVWDALFGTRHAASRPSPIAIGNPVLPAGYLDQLRAPFQAER